MQQQQVEQDNDSLYDLIEKIRRQPKIATDQGDPSKIYLLTELDRESDVDDVAKQAVAGSRDVCGELTEGSMPPITHFLLVEKLIEKGGFGAVYKIESRSKSGKDVDQKLCLKMGSRRLPQGDGEEYQKEINESIFNESKILKILLERPHENIIGFRFACISLEGDVFVGLEHFAGETISSMIHKFGEEGKTIPFKVVHSILRQTLAALKCLNALDIVHCDIKPSNILYNCVTDSLKLIDFGSAVQRDELQKSDSFTKAQLRCLTAGTAEYMPYEILRDGLEGVQENSDVYSLGTLGFRLITLQVPWYWDPNIHQARQNWDRLDQRERDQIRSGIKNRILAQCKDCKLTPLQERIVSKKAEFYRCYSVLCDLVHTMLHRDTSDRPSCETLISKLDGIDRLQQVSSRTSLNGKEDNLPTTIAALDSTNTAETSIPRNIRESDAELSRRHADLPQDRDRPHFGIANPEDEVDDADETGSRTDE